MSILLDPEKSQAMQSRPRREVLAEVMDSRRQKSEHEHVAAREILELRECLRECANDLEVYIEREYAPLRGYPGYERKRSRDLEFVRRARELIEA